MAKVVTPISAKVEVIGKVRDGNYGAYRPALFLDQSQPSGSEEAKIWKSLTEAEAEPLTKGCMVQLVPAGNNKNGDVKHNIVLMDAPSPAPAANPDPGYETTESLSDRREKMRRYIHSMSLLYAECYGYAQNSLAELEAPPEAVQACASSLFIATERKFKLI